MALPLLVPAQNPSVGSTNDVSVRERAARYGDGYEQRGENGINSRPISGRWTWQAMESADADDLVAFLSDNAITGFRYTFPGEAAERNYRVVGNISRSYVSETLQGISVQIEQIFDPV